MALTRSRPRTSHVGHSDIIAGKVGILAAHPEPVPCTWTATPSEKALLRLLDSFQWWHVTPFFHIDNESTSSTTSGSTALLSERPCLDLPTSLTWFLFATSRQADAPIARAAAPARGAFQNIANALGDLAGMRFQGDMAGSNKRTSTRVGPS